MSKRTLLACVVIASLSFLALAAERKDKWWPSEWGEGDQRGAANRMTAARVVEASKLIKTGKTYQLGRIYENGMPNPPGSKRHFSLTIPGSPTGVNGSLVHHDELVSGEIGQVGTQFDGLGHVGVRVEGEDYFYNGFIRSEFGDAYGLKKLGVENAGVFYARGVLVDVAAYRGVDRMMVGEEVTVEDITGAIAKQGVEIKEGDIVLVRTGHGKLWMTDNAGYTAGEPGIGPAAAKWLASRKVTLVGGDSWGLEVVPGPEDVPQAFSAHIELLVRNGIYIIENLDLEDLAKDKVYEFAFIYAPLRLKGATGSPGNPIAVR